MKRKANGDGSVFQVSENKWIAKISLGTLPSGKVNVKQFSGKTEAIVRKKLKEFKKSRDFAEKHLPVSDTVQSYFTAWMREYQFNKLKPLSYDRLESTVVNHIFPHMGGLKFDKVTRNQIQALINELYKKQKLSHSSVKKVYHALNACYKHAIVSDIVTKNPCIGIVLPSAKERTREISALSDDEVAKLKQELGKTTSKGDALYRYEHAYLLILHTGLRMGEALSLSWNDIDFENKTITVSVGDVFMDIVHEYPHLTVHLTLFNAAIAESEPQKLEHNDIQWIVPSEISDYEFCPADEKILHKIKEEYNEQRQKADNFHHQLSFIRHSIDILCYRQAANGLKQIVFKEVNVGVVVLNDFFNREFLFYQYSGGQ